MQNRNYGKLVDGNLQIAQNPLVVDGQRVWTNDPAVFQAQGYSPITYTDRPEREGYYYTDSYELQNGAIVQVWTEHEIPPITDDTELSDSEAIAVILGGDIV